MDLRKTICDLSNASFEDAYSLAENILSKYSEVSKSALGNITGYIKGISDYTILLDAHIDEIHFVVTSIDNKGFLKVAKCGGIDARVLTGCEVTVWGKKTIFGVFCSVPPHLKKNDDGKASSIDELSIDIGFSRDQAEKIVSIGDKVSFRQNAMHFLGNNITGKALDDRSGVASLLYFAYKISNLRKLPPVNVIIQLSQFEELGGMGAKTGSFASSPDEAVAVDVSFGDNVGLSEDKCKKLGCGPMIGIAPVLNQSISDKLISVSSKSDIRYQIEVMSGTTGTNADNILTSLSGIPCGLVSIPLRSMHTPVEVVNLDDVSNTAELLYNYIMDGGICNE